MRTAVARLLSLATFAPSLPSQERVDEWMKKPVDDATFEVFRTFFTYDKHTPFDTRVLDSTIADGVSYTHLTFESTPGARVFADLYEPVPRTGSPKSIILLHGGSARGKSSIRILGEYYAKAGFRALAIDLPYYGERRTNLLVSFSDVEKHEKLYNQEALYLSFVTQVVKDVGRSIDFLVQERGADPRRIALVGASRGAVLSSIVGAVDKRLAAVALLHGGHFDAREVKHLAAACPANYIGRIAPRPLLFVNGTEDAIFAKEEQVEPMHRLAKEPTTIIWLSTGHVFPPEETRAQVARWLNEVMR